MDHNCDLSLEWRYESGYNSSCCSFSCNHLFQRKEIQREHTRPHRSHRNTTVNYWKLKQRGLLWQQDDTRGSTETGCAIIDSNIIYFINLLVYDFDKPEFHNCISYAFKQNLNKYDIYFKVRKIHLKLFHHFVFVQDLAVLGLFHQVFSTAKRTEIKKKTVEICKAWVFFLNINRKFGSPIVMDWR